MPFDPMTRKELFWASEPMERLRMLADDLRGPLPDFTWDFGIVLDHNSCGTAGCAMGWSDVMYGTQCDRWTAREIAETFGISEDVARAIFMTSAPCGMDNITPLMVAIRIDDAYAATRRTGTGE